MGRDVDMFRSIGQQVAAALLPVLDARRTELVPGRVIHASVVGARPAGGSGPDPVVAIDGARHPRAGGSVGLVMLRAPLPVPRRAGVFVGGRSR